MEDFVTLLKALMVEEKGYTTEDAERMVKAHPDIVSAGIMHGNSKLRATAMALEIRESEKPNALAHVAEASEANMVPVVGTLKGSEQCKS